ncbi:MAG: hypothetical protein GX308_00710 [Epulopiscium sp.]|nr:hypothetical protein [Candidatus Epulonipiscium sp.]
MVRQIQDVHLIINQNQMDLDSSMPHDWKPGELLEGEVIYSEENHAIIEIEKMQIEVKTNEKLEDIGSSIKLEVQSISKGEIRLEVVKEKQVRPIKQYDRIHSFLRKESIPISKQNIEIAQKIADGGIHLEKKIFENVIETKKQIEKIINTMAKQEARELLESPFDVEKISLDIITRFLSDNTSVKEDIPKEEIENKLKKFVKKEKETIEQAIKALLENDLPLTRKNIDSLIFVQEKIKTVKDMEDRAISWVIKKDLPSTLNNLYASVFSSGKEDIRKKSTTPYEDVGVVGAEEHEFSEEEIKALLINQKIPTEDENINGAKFLIKHNIEVNKGNVERLLVLKKELEILDKEKVLDKSTKLLKGEKNPGNVELLEVSPKEEEPLTKREVKELVKDINNIDEDAIKRILRKNIPINLKNLRKEQSIIDNEPIIEGKINEDIIIEKDINFITAKRQLEEVRLKMTLEAAAKLNQKMNIDTAPLKEIVKELKVLEEEHYKDALIKAGAEASKENIKQLDELYKKLEVVNNLDDEVLPKVIKKEVEFIIDDLYNEQLIKEAAEGFKAEVAFSRYEEMETKPDKRFKDTIKDFKEQVKPLLIEQDIEPTKENIRCARILVQNEIEVTKGNITHLKWLDKKVTYVTKNLHPVIGAEMIKEGFRPDKILVDKVIDYIKGFDYILGRDSKDNLYEFILQMDEEKTLSSEQREGMIGIYRMLHTISKSNGKVIGLLMKNDMKFTLNNLMEGAKYLERNSSTKQDMNVLIDDNFGLIDRISFHEKSIRTQLEKAFGDRDYKNKDFPKMHLEYLEEILEDFTKMATPTRLKEWIKDPDFMRMDLEEVYIEHIKEGVKQSPNIESDIPVKDEEAKEFLDTLQNLKKIKQDTLIFMVKNQIPINIKNLQVVSSMMENPFEFGKSLEELNHILKNTNKKGDIKKVVRDGIEGLKREKTVDEVLDKVKEKIEEAKQELLDSSLNHRQNSFKTIKDIEKIMDIQKQIQKQEDLYQIPMVLNGKITNMNVYLLKDREKGNAYKDNETSAFVSIKTENIGIVQMYVHINDKNIDFKISGETKEITQYLKGYEKDIKSLIENIGYNVSKAQFTQDLKDDKVQNPLISPIKKSSDSDFEITI